MKFGGTPLPPLTENHSAQKHLAESGVPSPQAEKICYVVLTGSLREAVKNGLFTVRLTARGGGVSPHGPDHVKCDNFDPF